MVREVSQRFQSPRVTEQDEHMAKCINGIPSREERESGQSWMDYEEMAEILRHSWPIRDKVAQRAANGSFSTVQVSEVPSYEGI